MSNVRDFGALGDGQNDDSEAFRHALDDGDGLLELPPGTYRLTRPIVVDLDKSGRFGLDGSLGGAKVIMSGAGPAFHLVGTHDKSALPAGFEPRVWNRQRMPIAMNVEIEGGHPQADGFWLEGTMQSTFQGVLLRGLRHAIRVTKRARNVLVSHSHLYDNRGIGIWFDGVNLHQAIITGSHISYCKRGGIRITQSEIRNLQITGNDIEYNFDQEQAESADIGIDASEAGSSVREATIASNTIQAVASPGGANIRLIGFNPEDNHRVGMLSITGNLIGSQETNIHLLASRGVIVSGNFIYSATRRNVLVEGSRHVVLQGNCFEHNPDYREKQLCVGVRFVDSRDLTFGGSVLHDSRLPEPTVPNVPPMDKDGLMEIVRCQRINVQGCQFLDGNPAGIDVLDSELVSIQGCGVLEPRQEKSSRAAIRLRGSGRGFHLVGNTISRGVDDAIVVEPGVDATLANNLIVA